MHEGVAEVAIFIEFEWHVNSEVSRSKGYIHNQLLCTTYNDHNIRTDETFVVYTTATMCYYFELPANFFFHLTQVFTYYFLLFTMDLHTFQFLLLSL